jgi:hypothetical protein
MTDIVERLRVQWEAAKREAEAEVRTLKAEVERLRAARNALMWAIDYFGASNLTEKERLHGVLEIGKVLTGRPSRASTYAPNKWDKSAKLRAALEPKP